VDQRQLADPSKAALASLGDYPMKKLGLFLLAAVATALVFSGSAMAQDYPFAVTYFSNNVAGAPDGTARFINDGNTGGDLWANLYVFDDSQELVECGACQITPDGVLSEDVKTELTSNPLTGRVPSRGVIKMLSSTTSDPTHVTLRAGVRGWATHIQRATPTSGTYYGTETTFTDSTLGATEFSELQALCAFAEVLGSGQGTITCTPEDHDF
jgi:hypothetical protein